VCSSDLNHGANPILYWLDHWNRYRWHGGSVGRIERSAEGSAREQHDLIATGAAIAR